MSDFKYKHGLCVMRAQPFHIGHQKLVNQMLIDCAYVTIALGSIQEQGTDKNPFDYATRRKMIENIYQSKPEYNRLKIIGLSDINNPSEWGTFVLEIIKEKFPELPLPEAYYAGSEEDADWFKSCCAHIELVDRYDPNFPLVSATMVRNLIKSGDNRWKNFVASENHQLIESKFRSLMK